MANDTSISECGSAPHGVSTSIASVAVRRTSLAGDLGRVAGFALLIALAAQIKMPVPGTPVPVTMQTVAVLLCGFFLRPVLAVGAVAFYLVAGLLGTPIFAVFEAGIRTATLGYLVGFLAAAGLVSWLRWGRSELRFGRAMLIAGLGTAAIFACGVAWFGILSGNVFSAIQGGLLPFVPWALVKIVIAAGLASRAAGNTHRRNRGPAWGP